MWLNHVTDYHKCVVFVFFFSFWKNAGTVMYMSICLWCSEFCVAFKLSEIEKIDALLKIWQSSPTHCLLSIFYHSFYSVFWSLMLEHKSSVPVRMILNIKYYWHSRYPRTTVMKPMGYHFVLFSLTPLAFMHIIFARGQFLKFFLNLWIKSQKTPVGRRVKTYWGIETRLQSW